MKKSIYAGIGCLSAVALLASGCSSDYLDEQPVTSIGTSIAVGSAEAAHMSVLGMARAMFTQYYDLSYPRGCSGEGTFNAAINDALGPDDCSIFNMWELGVNWYPWKSMALQTSTFCQSAWMYAYNFVGQANTIIAAIPSAEGDLADLQFTEAQARTFRAFGYIKALQWFGPRWQDSNNGEKAAVVLRLEPGTGPAPLGTMNEVLDAIYDDLDIAIDLYKKSGLAREASYEPDLYVAYGLYARAALIRNDWNTAQTMAHNARQGREVMSLGEYFTGFMAENDEYMWTNFDNDIYYSSPGSWFSCCGAYPCNWEGGFSINIDLYDQLDPNDYRRQLYFMPDRVNEVSQIAGYEDVASITRADFFSEENVIVSEVNCMASDKMAHLAEGFVQLAANNNAYSSSPSVVRWPYSLSAKADPTSMDFGASVKMWSYGYYGDSAYPYMRAAEMYLTEAEAAYMAGDIQTAKDCLTAVNSKRIAGYSCTTSGDALLNEIRVTRRIELWGEGFNFPDFKRWNLPFEKRAFKAGDTTSGNCAPAYAFKVETSTNNGWRLAIPQQEIDANPGIDRSQLN